MNIVKLLNEKGVTTQIRFYGIDDMATGFEIKVLLENKDFILDHFKNLKYTINQLDDYIDYLYLKCVSSYEEVIPYVREDIKEDFDNEIQQLKTFFNKYQVRDLAKYVREHYIKIFEEEYEELYIKHDVIDFTIELLIKFFPNEKQIIDYIVNNFSYKVYDNFDSFKKIFNKDTSLSYYKMLLSEKLLVKDTNYRLGKIKVVLESLKGIDEKLYNEKVDLLVNMTKKTSFNTDEARVMNTYNDVKGMRNILKELKHKSCYEFDQELEKQSDILDSYLTKNGNSTKFEISIKPVVDIYEDSSKEWYQRSLVITHSLDKNTKKKLITNLEYAIKYCERSAIMDHIGTSNTPTDNEFTYSVVNNISIFMMQGKYSINYMLNDDNRLNDLLAYVFAGIDNYFGKESLYYNSEKFEFDLDMLFNAIKDFKEASSNKDELKSKWLIYGIENLLCGIIEKTLRNIFYEKTKENRYVNSHDVTLGSLLNSEEVRNEVGQENCNCFEYFLLNRRGVGKNNRNDFSHYNDSIYEKLVYDTLLEELYLLVSLSNTLLLLKSK